MTFAPRPRTLDLLSVEARGANLARVGAELCKPRVAPFINGSAWEFAVDALTLSANHERADRGSARSPVTPCRSG